MKTTGYYGAQPHIDDDGSVTFPGVDFEGRKLSVHYRNRFTLVVKVTGGSGWAGRGERSYRGAEFIVMQRESEKSPWNEVVTFPLRKETK